MASPLDMSLDDLIKNNKKPDGAAGGRGRGRGFGPSGGGAGPARRISNRSGNRSAPYSVGKAPDTTWRQDLHPTATRMSGFPHSGAPRAAIIETGVKLYISNLDYGVSNEDIKELFSEVGVMKRYSINYDRSGRSKGTAEVVFARRADAMAAISRYNDVQLDGKPMKIELVVPDVPPPPPAPYSANGSYRNPNGVSKRNYFSATPTNSFANAPSGSGRGSTGWSRGGDRGRGRGRGRGEPVSADALDADLDKYHTAAMETN